MTPSITDWLMVIVTTIYVVATVFICIFNYLSAKASRDQIAESQRQQAQNMALQQYQMRREVVHKFLRKEYEDLYADIPLLFSDDLLAEFASYVEQEKALNFATEGIRTSEIELENYFKEHETEVIIQSRCVAVAGGDAESVNKNINVLAAHRGVPFSFNKLCSTYMAHIIQAQALTPVVNEQSSALKEKLTEFVRASIQQ